MATPKSTTASKAPVGNKQTEVIIGSAASKLTAAVKSLEDAFGSVKGIDDAIESKTLTLVNLEAKIEGLESEYSKAKQEQDFALQMDFKTNSQKKVEEILRENGLVSVSADEYNDLKNSLAKLKAEYATEMSKEISKAKAIAESNAEITIKQAELTQQAKEAENKAQLIAKDAQIKSLYEQVENWKEALAEERKAGVQRAQAGSIGSVNVTSAK